RLNRRRGRGSRRRRSRGRDRRGHSGAPGARADRGWVARVNASVARRTFVMDWQLGLSLLASLLVWQGVDQVQARIPLSPTWAVLDEIAHASVAAFVLFWTWTAWGWRPTLAAVF